MGRKKKSVPHGHSSDPRYGDPLVTQFINCIMRKGKKTTAQRIFYGAMDLLQEKLPEEDPLKVFTTGVENVKPLLEVKSRRVGGANYQVPIEVRTSRRAALAIRWLLEAAKARPERTMAESLAFELLDAYRRTGIAMKKKEDTHRMAEANKAFAHYRW